MLCLSAGDWAGAGTLKEFELKDGSVIKGEILSYANGEYRLKSKTLGDILISEDQIQSIHFAPRSKSRSQRQTSQDSFDNITLKDLGIGSDTLKQMEQKILGDPETARLLEKLQSDPSMQKILQDKELMRAINKGDLGTIASDPKIQGLMNNQTVEEIIERSK